VRGAGWTAAGPTTTPAETGATTAVRQRECVDRSGERRTNAHVPRDPIHPGQLVHRQRADGCPGGVEHGEGDLRAGWDTRESVRDGRTKLRILSAEAARAHPRASAGVRLEEQRVPHREQVRDARLFRLSEMLERREVIKHVDA